MFGTNLRLRHSSGCAIVAKVLDARRAFFSVDPSHWRRINNRHSFGNSGADPEAAVATVEFADPMSDGRRSWLSGIDGEIVISEGDDSEEAPKERARLKRVV